MSRRRATSFERVPPPVPVMPVAPMVTLVPDEECDTFVKERYSNSGRQKGNVCKTTSSSLAVGRDFTVSDGISPKATDVVSTLQTKCRANMSDVHRALSQRRDNLSHAPGSNYQLQVTKPKICHDFGQCLVEAVKQSVSRNSSITGWNGDVTALGDCKTTDCKVVSLFRIIK